MGELQEWLYVLRPTRLEMVTEGATDEEARIVGEHFNHLKQLVEEGVVVLMGRTQNNNEDTLGLVIFRAEDEDAAQAILESDPAIIGGVMSAKLYPYRIALMGEILN